jgi:hypothetical protein
LGNPFTVLPDLVQRDSATTHPDDALYRRHHARAHVGVGCYLSTILSAPRVGWSAAHGGSFTPELPISAAHDRHRHARALTDGDLLRMVRIVASRNTKLLVPMCTSLTRIAEFDTII